MGNIPVYCILKYNIPAYDIEGDTQNPVLERAISDMATEEDLHAYQQKHYHAILNVLRCLSRINN